MKKNIPDLGGAVFVLSALLVWFITGAITAIISTLIISRLNMGEGSLGYISSALSFIAAAAAGFAAMRKRKKAAIITGLLCALAIIITALTLGLSISGGEPSPGAVLSVVSFTLCGALFGSVLCPVNRMKSAPRGFSLSKK